MVPSSDGLRLLRQTGSVEAIGYDTALRTGETAAANRPPAKLEVPSPCPLPEERILLADATGFDRTLVAFGSLEQRLLRSTDAAHGQARVGRDPLLGERAG